MDKFITPILAELRFTCPHCGTLAGISWDYAILENLHDLYFFASYNNSKDAEIRISVSTCKACGNFHLWLEDEMIVPTKCGIPMPNEDMPGHVKNIYIEARNVFPHSAKASAALLRLAVQILCKELGGEGKNINDDIAILVERGLPVKIQQALDVIRVIGNNAVHPGTINLDDNSELAALLFRFINVIVHDMITQPNSINELYSQLPQGTLNAIDRRDKKV